jgi:hypothetical protein
VTALVSNRMTTAALAVSESEGSLATGISSLHSAKITIPSKPQLAKLGVKALSRKTRTVPHQTKKSKQASASKSNNRNNNKRRF